MLIRNEFKPYMAPRQEALQTVHKKNNTRLLTLMGIISLSFAGLAGYSFFVQSYNEAELNRLAADRVERSISEPALRGTILDRNGAVLAVSRPMLAPTFNPKAIFAPKQKGGEPNMRALSDKQYAGLAAALDMPEDEVRAKLTNLSSGYVNFKTELTLEQADAVRALNIPTLRFEARSERTYPYGNLFSHIVGFANNKGEGLEGLEHSQNKRLSGEDGRQMVLRDRHGNIVELTDSPQNAPARPGENIILSVDQEMQQLARSELSAAVRHFNAKAGGVVVLDAQTGEILAMASLPDYDANYYQQYPGENRRNYAVGVTMEPGSVMKPFVVAKALDEGKIGRNSWFNTRPYELSGKTIKDTHLYPSLSTEGILQKSSNVGTSRIAELFPNHELHDYFEQIGFGRKTGSGVSGEQSAAIKPANRWGRLDKAVMSYGYAITANLLQMAQGYTIFTTDGRLMPATVFKQSGVPQGEQVIKPETARMMREMMISVTRKGGTGQQGAIPGYDVAGKTGTAKKAGSSGYEEKYRASFVGFAPAKNPRLIVAVTIDEPRTRSYYGGTVAGPVFRNVMAGGLKHLGVKPTYAVTEEQTRHTAKR